MATDFFEKKILLIISIPIVLVLATLFIPFLIAGYSDFDESPVFAYVFGINLILVVIGLLILILFVFKRCSVYLDNENIKDAKVIENAHKEKIQELFNEDAETRRVYEQKRYQINDMFRLFELAKEKEEEITDKTKTIGEETLTEFTHKDVFTKKYEIVNIEKLDKLIVHYQNLNIRQ